MMKIDAISCPLSVIWGILYSRIWSKFVSSFGDAVLQDGGKH